MAASYRALPWCSHAPLFSLCLLLVAVLLQTCECVPNVRHRRQFSDNLFYTSVCEGSTMDLRCPPGQVITIVYANFGRVDNVTCTSGPVLTTQCYSENAKEIVAQGCNNRGTCTIHATMQLFGDPCPEEPAKFLEVKLRCREPTTTTQPPTTKTVATTTTPPTTTVTPTTTAAATTTTEWSGTDFSPGGVETTLASSTTTALTPAPTTGAPTTVSPTTTAGVATEKVTTKATTTPVPPTTPTVPMTTKRPEFCLPVIVRDVQWQHTPAGVTNEQDCPPGHTGVAYWECSDNPSAHWVESGPDLSDCVSIKLQNITNQLEQGASVAVISEDLAQTVDDGEELYGGDIVTVTNILTTSLETLDQQLENATAEEKTETTKEVTKNYLKVGSAILEDSNLDSWDDLPDDTQTQTASSLITSLEESAFLLADTLDDDQTLVEEEANVVMEVVVRGEDEEGDLVFPDPSQLSGDWQGITDSITLPADTLKERTKDGKTRVVLLAYNNIGQFLGVGNGTSAGPEVTTHSPSAQKQVSSRPCWPDEEWETVGSEVNSRVLSVSINDPWHSTPLIKPVNLTFEHAEPVRANLTDPVCSFWKFDNKSNEFLAGDWSDRGCALVHSNSTHTVCSCDHLTNFAVIMNVKRLKISRPHLFALSFITYFGFIISIPCLTMALITFCIFKNLQSDRTTIHKNLCLSLLMAEVIFVAGISQTANRVVCGVIALLLHYFFLSSFAWMCLEGIQLYIMLVEVFEAESSRRKYYYPFGYILPLIIVGISAAVDFRSYGTPEYCWLCTDGSLKWAFVGPVCVIIFGNILFLSMALYIMCKHSSLQTNPREKTPKEKATGKYRRLSGPINYLRRSSSIFTKQNRRTSKEIEPLDVPADNSDRLISLVRGALVLLCLLGVTWGFGLLYVHESLITFAYIFTITNAFQGLFIYIFHCCMNDKVRKEYRRYVRNSTWLPECIREQYGGTFITNSNQQNSYRSSSAAQKRNDSKRFSNTTGSYSVDHRKLSNSSVYRNSGQYEQVKFSSEMSVPEEEQVDFGGAKVIADEGISMDFEETPVLESTRIDAEGADSKDTPASDSLSVHTTEFLPLILDMDKDDQQKHAKLINVGEPENGKAESPIQMHPLIRESGIGGSRSGSSSSEDFAPASPLSQDKPTKALLFPNRSTCGMTGSMPDLINPLTAHACKARMDLVPVAYDAPLDPSGHAGYHTLPNAAPSHSQQSKKNSHQNNTLPLPTPTPTPTSTDSHPQSDPRDQPHQGPSPWHKRASRMHDIEPGQELTPKSEGASPSLEASPDKKPSNSPLETVI